MTLILLDDQPLTAADDVRCVRDVIAALRAPLRARDRLVTRINCDGVEPRNEALEAHLDRALAQVNTLSLRSECLSTLVLGTLRAAQSVLADLTTTCSTISAALTMGRSVEAMQALGDFMRSWGQTLAAAQGAAQALALDVSGIEIGGQSLDSHLMAVTRSLHALKEALASGDLVLVADQLRYEMVTTIDAWQSVLGALILAGEAHAATTAMT